MKCLLHIFDRRKGQKIMRRGPKIRRKGPKIS
jgi:hypothetical protein